MWGHCSALKEDMGWLHRVQRLTTLNRVHEPSLHPEGTGCVCEADPRAQVEEGPCVQSFQSCP